MRKISYRASTGFRPPAPSDNRVFALFALIAALAAAIWAQACAAGGAGSVAAGPPPVPARITVSVTPTNASILLGNAQAFTAAVSNANNASVTWSVNGISGGNSTFGTITSAGVYTAPKDLPFPLQMQVTATSDADPAKSASANVTITSDLVLNISPSPASVELGATQNFQTAVTSAGHPDTAVRWSLSGMACSLGCGTIDSSGNYTAPQILPTPTAVTVIAQSVADPSRQASAIATITSNFTLQLAAPATVPLSGTATVTATLTALAGSNPSRILGWSLSGAGCSGAACGTLNVITTQATGQPSTSSAIYRAPLSTPSPNTITVAVTPVADPSKKAQALIAVQPGVVITVVPGAATLAANHRVTLAVQVSGASNTGVSWTVNGISGGNSTFGQICATGLTPCQPITGANNLQVDYLAPGTIPTPNPVTIQATSAADPTKSAGAQITIINHVVISVSPNVVTLAPLAIQNFTATVLGTSNQSVVWQIQGTACAIPGICGSVDASGTYTAPGGAPSPNTLQVVAVSSDDTSQSASANVTITTAAQILALHPASVYAGAANGFTLRVDGSNFAPTSPGPGSVLLIGGTARTTTCAAVTECTAPVTPVDVAVPGNLSVQLSNASGAKSNAVSLVILAPNTSDQVIALSSVIPSAIGEDIVVVDPTTAGVSVPGSDLDLNVAALGVFSIATNSCNLAGNPVPLMRPSTGVAAADICLFSQSGLDASMTYLVSGPGDVTVVAKQPAGLGIIHLTLQVAAAASPGARTLFVQNTNLDKAAASGALEVE